MQRLIPKGWYTAKITQAYEDEDNKGTLRICYTIDSGEFSYRHVIREYPLNKFGMEKLENHFIEINRFLFLDYTKDLFFEQFIGIRTEIHIDRGKLGNVIRNFILEMRLTTKGEDYNVLKPKKEEHFHKGNKGRKLPICNYETTKQKQFKK